MNSLGLWLPGASAVSLAHTQPLEILLNFTKSSYQPIWKLAVFAPGKQILGLVSPCRCLSLSIFEFGCLPCDLGSFTGSGKVVSFFFVPVFPVVDVAAMLFPTLYIFKGGNENRELLYFQGMALGQGIKRGNSDLPSPSIFSYPSVQRCL